MSGQVSESFALMTEEIGGKYVDRFMEVGRRPYRFREFMEAETPGLDDTVTTQDLQFLMPETLNRHIITLAEDARIGRNFVDVMKINSESESFLREYGFSAAVVSEGGEIPLAKVRHDKLVLTVFKTGVRPRLTYEAMADAKFPILQRNINQAALAMARYEDSHIMATLNAGVPDNSTIIGTEEADHSFAATGNVLSHEDMVNCYISIVRENLSPTDIIVHPYQIGQILDMNSFRQTIGIGASGPETATVQPQFQFWNSRMETMYGNAQIGNILGCKIWMTNNQTAGKLLMIDRNNYGILAERRPLLTESQDDIIHQMHTVAFTQRYCAGIINNDGSANITELKTTI